MASHLRSFSNWITGKTKARRAECQAELEKEKEVIVTPEEKKNKFDNCMNESDEERKKRKDKEDKLVKARAFCKEKYGIANRNPELGEIHEDKFMNDCVNEFVKGGRRRKSRKSRKSTRKSRKSRR
uniref:Uncharacterized protein n=1 Tax=viral metagenome TaxID=1070528 RepID=A0A6C0D348_9ZZZZ